MERLEITSRKESCEKQFLVFDLTRQEIEPESNVSAANALSTRPLIGIVTSKLCANIAK